MPWFMARPIYILTAPDGSEVGTLYETQTDRLVIRLDPGFHDARRRRRSDAPDGDLPHLVIRPA